MPMKTSTKAVKALILNFFMTVVLCLVAEGLAVLQGQIPGFIFPMFCINFVVAYCCAFLVAMLVPHEKWGVAFALSRGEKPGSKKFGLYVGIIINTVYSVILCAIMSWFNACVLGGAPIIGAVFGFLTDIIPVWIACFIVSLIFNGPAEKWARSITHDQA